MWVRHADVEAHLRLGWMVAIPRKLVGHDRYAVLMMWICACEVRRPAHDGHRG
jgi:hypothetical protein